MPHPHSAPSPMQQATRWPHCRARPCRCRVGLHVAALTRPARPPSPAAGYPLDVPPPGAGLLTYAVLVYHLPLLIGFSLRPRAPFVWGGCMLLPLAHLRADTYGIMAVRAAGVPRLAGGPPRAARRGCTRTRVGGREPARAAASGGQVVPAGGACRPPWLS